MSPLQCALDKSADQLLTQRPSEHPRRDAAHIRPPTTDFPDRPGQAVQPIHARNKSQQAGASFPPAAEPMFKPSGSLSEETFMGAELRDSIRGVAVTAGALYGASTDAPLQVHSLADTYDLIESRWSELEHNFESTDFKQSWLDERIKVFVSTEMRWLHKVGDTTYPFSWWFEVFVGTPNRAPAITCTAALAARGFDFSAWGCRNSGPWLEVRTELQSQAEDLCGKWLGPILNLKPDETERFDLVIDSASVENRALARAIAAGANGRIDSVGDLERLVEDDPVAAEALRVAWGDAPTKSSSPLGGSGAEEPAIQWRVESSDDVSAIYCGHILDTRAAYRGLISHSELGETELARLIGRGTDATDGAAADKPASRSAAAIGNRVLAAQLCLQAGQQS